MAKVYLEVFVRKPVGGEMRGVFSVEEEAIEDNPCLG